MALFVDLVREISLDVPGCPDFLVEPEILNAAIAFCEESEVYTAQLTGTTVAGDDTYTVVTPTDTKLVSLLAVNIDNKPVNGMTEISRFYNPEKRTGTPTEFYARDNSFVFVPTPNKVMDYLLLVSLKPTRTADGLDDNVTDDWYKAITQLALHNLTVIPERAWTSPVIAQTAFMTYQQELSKAKLRRAGRQRVVRKTRFAW